MIAQVTAGASVVRGGGGAVVSAGWGCVEAGGAEYGTVMVTRVVLGGAITVSGAVTLSVAVTAGGLAVSVPALGPMQYQFQLQRFCGQPDRPPICGLKASSWKTARWFFSAKDSQVSPGMACAKSVQPEGKPDWIGVGVREKNSALVRRAVLSRVPST